MKFLLGAFGAGTGLQSLHRSPRSLLRLYSHLGAGSVPGCEENSKGTDGNPALRFCFSPRRNDKGSRD